MEECPHCGGRVGKVLLGDEVEAKCLDCDSYLSPDEVDVEVRDESSINKNA